MIVYATTPPVATDAFYRVSGNINITVPYGTLAAYQEADGWKNFIYMTEETPPTTYEDGYLYCGELKFRILSGNNVALTYRNNGTPRYSNLPQAVTIPDTLAYNGTNYIVTSIDANTFTGCNNVSSISIPSTVTSVGALAFAQCAGLVRVVFRDGDTPITLTNASSNALFNGSPVTKLYLGRDVVYSNTTYPTFKGNTSIEELTIGSQVTTIPSSSFYGCSNMTKVSFSGSKLTKIDDYAFQSCSKLENVSLPRSVTTFGKSAFSGCTGLTSASLRTSSTSLSESLFSGCTNLTSVTLPSSLTTIGSSTFYNCSKLSYISLPNTLTTIGASAFYGCKQLSSVTIPNSVTSIGGSAFSGCSGLTSITLPTSVTVINAATFQGCTNLASLTIPASVTSIGINAFKGCTSLSNVRLDDSENPLVLTMTVSGSTSTNQSPFLNCPIQTLYIGRDLTYSHYNTSYYFAPFANNTSLQSVTLGSNVTKIPKASFSGCTGLQSVTIPNTVTTIEQLSFKGCTNLGSISLPSSLTSISNELFSGCTSLSGITIPNTVGYIGSSAFYNCKSLNNITLPNGIANILESAFAGCTSLQSITIPGTMTDIKASTFSGCTALNNVTIPNSIVTIAAAAFTGCTSLEDLVIPGSVTAIGINAFKNCSALKYINFEDGSESLVMTMTVSGSASTNQSPFAGCPLDSLYIGRDLTYSHYSTSYYFAPFAEKTTLKKVTFGDNVKLIPDKSFNGCDAITTVTIPQSVTTIGDYAFYGKLLKEVHCAIVTPITINSNVFYSPANSILVVPASSVNAYKSANVWKTFGGIFAEGTNYVVPGSTIVKDGITYVINDGGSTVSVTSGDYTNLTEANIPPTVDYFGTTLTVTAIKAAAFSGCTGLTSLIIPNTVTSIGINAFKGCTGLTNVRFADGDTQLTLTMTVSGSQSTNQSPFLNCPNISTLYIGRNMIYSCYSTSYYFAPFAEKTKLSSLTIGNTVTSIPKKSFQGCTSLASVTIPAGVTSIGEYAFNSSSLREVHSAIVTPIPINSNVFNSPSSSILFVPSGSVDAYKSANVWKTFGGIYAEGTAVAIPGTRFENNGIWYMVNNGGTTANVTDYYTAGENGEQNYVTLTTANILSSVSCNGVTLSVTAINAGAFSGAKALTSVTIPASVTNVYNNAFANCTALADVTISDGTEALSFTTSSTNSSMPFYGCTGLTNLYVGRPITYTTSGYTPFRGLSSIKSVTTGGGMTTVPDYLCFGCSGLTSLTLSNATASIGQYAFYGCSSLKTLKLPASVTSIGTYAFYNNSALNTVVAYGATPPTIATSNTFNNRTSKHLYVEASAVNTYKATTYWKDFNIHPLEEYYALLTASYTKATVAVPTDIDERVALTKVTCNGKNYTPQTDGSIIVTGLVPGTEYTATIYYKLNGVATSYTKTFTTISFNPSISPNYTSTYTTATITFTFPKILETTDGLVLGDIGIVMDGDKKFMGTITNNNEDYYDVTCVANNLTPGGYYYYDIYYTVNGTQIRKYGRYYYSFQTKVIDITNVSVSTTQTTATVYYRVRRDAEVNITKFYVWLNSGDSIKATVTETTDSYYQLRCTLTGLNVNTSYYCDPGFYYNGRCSLSKSFTTSSVYGSFTKTVSPTTVNVKASPVTGDAKLKKAYFRYNNQELSELHLTGLKPETQYSIPYVVETQSGNQTNNVTFTTTSLSMTTEAARMLSNTMPLLMANTNLADEETSCGFEWKRNDAPDDFPPYTVYSPVTDGIICGTVQNMTENVWYRYRVFYKSSDGTMYYGNYISFITADAGIYYSPIAYTYANALVQQSGVTIQGVAMPGSEEILEQGFYYWLTGANHAPGLKTPAAGAQKVTAEGQRMSVTLTGLRPGSNYNYCAFVRTATGTTYGSDQSFKTEGLRGDINSDGFVNAGDVSAEYAVILSGNVPDMSIDDVNGDGNINVGDVAAIYNIILGRAQNAPVAMAECDDRFSAEAFALTEMDTRTLTLTLDNEQAYTAFQLDLLLPKGVEIVDAWLDAFRAAHHDLQWATMADGRVRFVASAIDNEDIDGTNGALLHISLRSAVAPSAEARLVVDGIVMAKSDESTYYLSPLAVALNGTTDINSLVENDGDRLVNVYTLGGQLVKRNVHRRDALRGLDSGYYLVDGKKVAVGR